MHVLRTLPHKTPFTITVTSPIQGQLYDLVAFEIVFGTFDVLLLSRLVSPAKEDD